MKKSVTIAIVGSIEHPKNIKWTNEYFALVLSDLLGEESMQVDRLQDRLIRISRTSLLTVNNAITRCCNVTDGKVSLKKMEEQRSSN